MSLLSCNHVRRTEAWWESVKMDYIQHASTKALGKTLQRATATLAAVGNDRNLQGRMISAFAGRRIAGAATIFFVAALVAIIAVMALTGTIGLIAPLLIPLAISAEAVAGLTLISLAGYLYNRNKLIQEYEKLSALKESEKKAELEDIPLPEGEPKPSEPKPASSPPPKPPLPSGQLEGEEKSVREREPAPLWDHRDLVDEDPEILELHREAAELGSPRALVSLGYFYLLQKNDVKSALYHFERAARAGDVEAMYQTGRLYHNQMMHEVGKVHKAKEVQQVPLTPAVNWYANAMEKGCWRSVEELGRIYMDLIEALDQGFRISTKEAEVWTEKILNQTPLNSRLLYQAGLLWEKRKSYTRAIQCYETIDKTDWVDSPHGLSRAQLEQRLAACQFQGQG